MLTVKIAAATVDQYSIGVSAPASSPGQATDSNQLLNWL